MLDFIKSREKKKDYQIKHRKKWRERENYLEMIEDIPYDWFIRLHSLVYRSYQQNSIIRERRLEIVNNEHTCSIRKITHGRRMSMQGVDQ